MTNRPFQYSQVLIVSAYYKSQVIFNTGLTMPENIWSDFVDSEPKIGQKVSVGFSNYGKAVTSITFLTAEPSKIQYLTKNFKEQNNG